MPNSHANVIRALMERVREDRRGLLAEMYEREGRHLGESQIEQLGRIQDFLDLLNAALEDENEVGDARSSPG